MLLWNIIIFCHTVHYFMYKHIFSLWKSDIESTLKWYYLKWIDQYSKRRMLKWFRLKHTFGGEAPQALAGGVRFSGTGRAIDVRGLNSSLNGLLQGALKKITYYILSKLTVYPWHFQSQKGVNYDSYIYVILHRICRIKNINRFHIKQRTVVLPRVHRILI